MTPAKALYFSLAVAFATALGVEYVRRLALRWALMDVPNERSSHVTPTPRGGGIVIAAAVLITLVAWGSKSETVAWMGLVAGGATVVAVSWIDDVRTISAWPRFAAQAIATLFVLYSTAVWDSVTLPGGASLTLGPASWAFALVWVVGLTNAFNFMDGIDGIAGLQAVISGGAWCAMGLFLNVPIATWTGGAVAAASLGFLVHNWSPARIFMGDVGSAFLGFILSGMGLAAADQASTAGGRIPLASLLVVWPFVFDAGYTFLRRLRAGEDVFAAHRSHLYQRLVIAGWSHRATATVYAACATVAAAAGVGWAIASDGRMVVLGLVGIPALILVCVRNVEKQGLMPTPTVPVKQPSESTD